MKKILKNVLLGLVITLINQASIQASENITVHGPWLVERSSGKPVIESDTFIITNTDAPHFIQINNGGSHNQFDRVSSAIITLNGKKLSVLTILIKKQNQYPFRLIRRVSMRSP